MVANILKRKRVVQVFPCGIRLMQDSESPLLSLSIIMQAKMTQEIPFEQQTVVYASLEDPYVVLLFANGSVLLARANMVSLTLELLPSPPLKVLF